MSIHIGYGIKLKAILNTRCAEVVSVEHTHTHTEREREILKAY